jgi:glycosyltransferase involved in cell wall biosynthesis
MTIRDRSSSFSQPGANSSLLLGFQEFKEWVRNGAIFRQLFHYREAVLLIPRLGEIPKPFLTAALLKLLSPRQSYFQEPEGRRQAITAGVLAKLWKNLVVDFSLKGPFLRSTSREVARLLDQTGTGGEKRLDLSCPPVYLLTDFGIAGASSGGSLGHIAGVLNNLEHFCGKPIFLTVNPISTVSTDLVTHRIPPGTRFWDYRELPSLFYNRVVEAEGSQILAQRPVAFIYQRYGAYNYAGVKLAWAVKAPLILEYNGSEIWVTRNWGRPLKYETLAAQIELLNLEAADLVVVVSQPLKDELLGRGIEAGKILVNPNGVDPARYRPGLDGGPVRRRYGLEGKTVIGFIGTFELWHGAEALAEAFGRLLRENPDYRPRVRLLMIGDGPRMAQVQKRLEQGGAAAEAVLTGRVPQDQGAEHLAACDLLASPHVPNPDGTPFFGSPTKLFEYMAMGKGIVASDLDQIGEILTHGRTAWMVPPGDIPALCRGLKILIEDQPLRTALGEAARREVATRYTWKEHTRKIVEKLRQLAVEQKWLPQAASEHSKIGQGPG